ncbi:hypothetical protein Tco_1502085 [Tanacetum coccineum]
MMELQDVSLTEETQLVVVVTLQEIDKHFLELMVVEELLEAYTVDHENEMRELLAIKASGSGNLSRIKRTLVACASC